MEDPAFLGQEELVALCNRVLVQAGLLARVSNLDEVLIVCSSTSLFVAALEGFLRSRLPEVVRRPNTPAERAYNNNQVVRALEQLLRTDLSHIDGGRCVEGCVEDIANLLELLEALGHDQPLLDPPVDEEEAARRRAELRPPPEVPWERLQQSGPSSQALDRPQDDSQGGASSTISIPTSIPGAGAQQPPGGDWDAHPGPPDQCTVLERALEAAEATLWDVERRAQEDTAAGAGAGRRRRDKGARAVEAGGASRQQRFLREAAKRLTGGASSQGGASGGAATSSRRTASGRAGAKGGRHAAQPAASSRRRAPLLPQAGRHVGPASPQLVAATRGSPLGGRRADRGPLGGGLRVLPGVVSTAGPVRQGAGRLARTAAAYTAALAEAGVRAADLQAAADAERGEGGGWDGEDEGEVDDLESERWVSDQGAWAAARGLPPLLALNAELGAKLRYITTLADLDPHEQAVRQRTQLVAVREEVQRQATRRQLLERLSSARLRRDNAQRLTAERLREQSAEHRQRVEQLRLERLAEQWRAQQRSAHMRHALKAELALREAFLEVLHGEKERLLAERRAAREAGARGPRASVSSAVRFAEEQYLAMYEKLVGQLAAERRERVAATREAQQATRRTSRVQADLVHDRLHELLGRVARDEAAALTRGGEGARTGSRDALVGQIRRVLGLA